MRSTGLKSYKHLFTSKTKSANPSTRSPCQRSKSTSSTSTTKSNQSKSFVNHFRFEGEAYPQQSTATPGKEAEPFKINANLIANAFKSGLNLMDPIFKNVTLFPYDLDNRATLLDSWSQTKFYSYEKRKFDQESTGSISVIYNFLVHEIVLNSALNERFMSALSLSNNEQNFMDPILMDYELN